MSDVKHPFLMIAPLTDNPTCTVVDENGEILFKGSKSVFASELRRLFRERRDTIELHRRVQKAEKYRDLVRNFIHNWIDWKSGGTGGRFAEYDRGFDSGIHFMTRYLAQQFERLEKRENVENNQTSNS